MELKIQVGDNSATLIDGVAVFLRKTVEALRDGFDPSDDLPPIALAAFTDLLPIIGNLPKIKDELAQYPDSRTILAALLVNEILDLV
jgi:hypothetical protein